MDMDLPLVETNFLLKPLEINKIEKFVDKRMNNVRDEERSNETFLYDKLSPGQQEIYNYIHENPNNIVVVQGFPRTGKTFTLRAIAHSWKKPVNVIIYKNDLLVKFQDNVNCIGNFRNKTQFFREMFHMPYPTFVRFEDELYGSLNNAEFLLTIVNLIAKADIKELHGSLVILDEYTVIPKPLLVVTLVLLKHYKIGAILCGDKRQLQSDESVITGSCTSYDIANVFADKSFWLGINETDSEYNKIVNYIRDLVTGKLVTGKMVTGKFVRDESVTDEFVRDEFVRDEFVDFAQSLIAAVFPKQLLHETIKFTDTHLAGSHQELKELADHLVSKEGHPCRPYEISTLDEERMERSSPKLFLNYLPLVVGSSYYVDYQSEDMKGKLVRVEKNKVVLRLNGKEITRKPSNNDSAIYCEHRNELLGGKEGTIYNFPIYPANFTTVMSEDRQVSGPLHIMFRTMTYHEMYVALSRVKDVSQLKTVSIDNPISHLSSCIINFEELIDSKFVISGELLKKKMAHYEYYDLKNCNPTKLSVIESLVCGFFREERPEARKDGRDALSDVIKLWSESKVFRVGDWTTSPIHEILKYTDYWLGLACMKEEDRGIWLSEFLARTPALRSLTGAGIEHKNIDEQNVLHTEAGLDNLPQWNDIIGFIQNKEKTDFMKKICKKYKDGRGHKITTNWLVDILNATIRRHSAVGKSGKENQDEGVSLNYEDSDEQESNEAEGSDEDIDSSVPQNSMKGKSVRGNISPMKRGHQHMEEDDDTVVKKKIMSNPSTVDKHDSE